MNKGNRFAISTEEEVEIAKKPFFATNTVKSAESAWRAFTEWRKCSEPIAKDDLGHRLCTFIIEHRKQDGAEYKSSSLLTIVRGIVRNAYLMQATSDVQRMTQWKFDDDGEFAAARNVLDRKMKSLQQDNNDAPIQAKPFNKSQIDEIFSSELLTPNNPSSLLKRLYFVIGLNTAARIEWHAEAKWTTISKTSTTENGLGYRTMPVGVDKNHAGGRNFETSNYYIVENKVYPDRCPLKLLDIYSKQRPQDAPDRLYLRPVNGAPKCGLPWYRKQPIGKNTLSDYIKNIALSLNFATLGDEKQKYTNHSLRATVPTILYHGSFDEQLISELTKHRSLHGVRSYKRTSVDLMGTCISAVTNGADRTYLDTIIEPINTIAQNGTDDKNDRETTNPTDKDLRGMDEDSSKKIGAPNNQVGAVVNFQETKRIRLIMKDEEPKNSATNYLNCTFSNCNFTINKGD